MIAVDAEVLGRFATAFDAEILNAIDPAFDTKITRKTLMTRNIGADKEFDEVTTRDRTGQGAVIGGKTVSNVGSGSSVTSDIYPQKKIVDGFLLAAKDLKLDPKLKARDIEIALSNVARKEDQAMIFGSTKENIVGLVTTAQANPLGKIMASGATGVNVDNLGAWDGSDPARDPYQDVLHAVARISKRFRPFGIGGNRTDLLNLWAPDSERDPFYKMTAGLFGKRAEDNPWGTWIFDSEIFTAGKVYVMVKDRKASELVISENPHSKTYAEQPGEVFPVEVLEFVRPQFYNNEGFVEIDVT